MKNKARWQSLWSVNAQILLIFIKKRARTKSRSVFSSHIRILLDFDLLAYQKTCMKTGNSPGRHFAAGSYQNIVLNRLTYTHISICLVWITPLLCGQGKNILSFSTSE